MFTHFGLWELLPANRIMRRKSSRETFSFKFSELLLWKQIYTEGSHSSSKDTESTLVPFYVHVLDVSILWFFWEVLVEKYPQNDRNYLPVQYIFLHGHPDCWGRVTPLGKKSFQIVFTKLTTIISIVLESESSDQVKHKFCIYIWFQIFYDIMHWQIETQGISKKVFFQDTLK